MFVARFNKSLIAFQRQGAFTAISKAKFSDVASASAVKKLREASGAPLMDCKKALIHANGDLQTALDWLRTKGISKASSSTRETKEGLIGVYTNATNNTVSLVEVNCETDFVSMNQDFQKFVGLVGETVNSHSQSSQLLQGAEILQMKPNNQSLVNIEQALGDIVASIRETIVVKRGVTISLPKGSTGILSSYVHGRVGLNNGLPTQVQLGKAASVLSFSVNGAATDKAVEFLSDAAGRKLAMHVVAAKPTFLAPENAPADFIEKELAIFREQSKDEKKKPEIIEKMIQGKLNKRLSEVCLLGQTHMAEEGNPVVKKYLEGLSKTLGADISVVDYSLWSLKQ